MNKMRASLGFSLIEVMVALVVLAVGVLAIARLQVAAIRGLSFSRHLTAATQLGERHAEWMKSVPFNDYLPVSTPPRNDSNQQLLDANGLSIFHDEVAGDGTPTNNWLLHALNPMNEEGQPATPDSMKYYVRWKVERGGLAGTGAVPPGPGQLLMEIEIIWWEGDDYPAAELRGSGWKNYISNDWPALRASGAHRVHLEGMANTTVW